MLIVQRLTLLDPWISTLTGLLGHVVRRGDNDLCRRGNHSPIEPELPKGTFAIIDPYRAPADDEIVLARLTSASSLRHRMALGHATAPPLALRSATLRR